MTRPEEPTLEQRRAALEVRFLQEARRLLDKTHEPLTTFGFSAGKVLKYRTREPGVSQIKELMIAAAVAVDKANALGRFAETKDNKGFAAVDAFITALMGDPPTPTAGP